MYNSQNLPLSPKKIIKKTIIRYSHYVIYTLWILFFLYAFHNILETEQINLKIEKKLFLIISSNPVLAFFTILIILLVPILIYEYLYYKWYFYEFGEEKAKIKKGVVSQATGYVRYEKLQNIYVDQDFLDRIFGLYDVHYETAGERSGFYSHVDGLNKENADKLIAFLEERLKQSTVNSKKEKEIPQPEISQEKMESQEKIEEEEISILQYPLSKSVITVKTISVSYSLIVILIITIPFFITQTFLSFNQSLLSFVLSFLASLLFLSLCFLIFFLTIIYYKIWYKNFYFRFGKNSGEIKTKVIGQSISYLYYDRIQNINLSQDFLERLFGIYSIIIETAGETSSQKFKIEGLSQESAEKIRDFLLAKAKYYRERL